MVAEREMICVGVCVYGVWGGDAEREFVFKEGGE